MTIIMHKISGKRNHRLFDYSYLDLNYDKFKRRLHYFDKADGIIFLEKELF